MRLLPLGSPGGLLLLIFIPIFPTIFGLYLTASHTFWTLARDNATPFPEIFGHVNQHNRNPSNAILLCASLCTLLGCIYLGSAAAFTAFVGSTSFLLPSPISWLYSPTCSAGEKALHLAGSR